MSESSRKRPKLDDVKSGNEDKEQLIVEEFQAAFNKLNVVRTQKNKEMKEKVENLERQRKSMEDKLGEMQSTCNGNGKKIRDLEEQLASKIKSEAELKDISDKIEESYENGLKEIKKLKDEHEKEKADMKAKMQDHLDSVSQKYEAEVKRLNSTNEKILKELSDAQVRAQKNENSLQKIKEFKEKDRNACQLINGQREKIQDLENQLKEAKAKLGVRYLALEQIRDGSTLSNDKIMYYSNVTVLKVARITQGCPGYWNLYSTDMPKEEPVNMKTSDFIKNTALQFQILGELDLNEFDFNMILPRIHSCSLTKLDLHGAVISLDIFKKLTAIKKISFFKNVVVKSELGSILKLDTILNELPNVSVFEMNEIGISIKSEICDSLNRHLPNLQQFSMKQLHPSFNLAAFGLFIKKNPVAEFYLQYCGLSQNEKNSVAKKKEEFFKTLNETQKRKVHLKY